MKYLILSFLLIISWRGIAQEYSVAGKQEFSSCAKVRLDKSHIQVKRSGRLELPYGKGKSVIFNDINSDVEAVVYEHLGDYPRLGFSLVMQLGFHDQVFFLLNQATGTIDTIIGPPVFSGGRYFASMNNPGTDEALRIQVGEITAGRAKVLTTINVKEGLFFESLGCVEKNRLLAKDNNGNYWKIEY